MYLTHAQRTTLVELQCPALLDLLSDGVFLETQPAFTNAHIIHLDSRCCDSVQACADEASVADWWRCQACVPLPLWTDVIGAAPIAQRQWQLSVTDAIPTLEQASPAAVLRVASQLWPQLLSLVLTDASDAIQWSDPRTADWAREHLARMRDEALARKRALATVNRQARPIGGGMHWVLVPSVTRVSHVTAGAAVLERWAHVEGAALALEAPAKMAAAYSTAMPEIYHDLGPVDVDVEQTLWPAFFAVYGSGEGCTAQEALETARTFLADPAPV